MAPRPKDEGVVNLAIRFPVDLHAAVKERAAAEDLTMSQLIRQALRAYLGAHRYREADGTVWCVDCLVNGNHPMIFDKAVHDAWHAVTPS